MNEEDKILKKFGRKNPYKVPEGYFENFTSKLMEELPEKEAIVVTLSPKRSWMRRSLIACSVAAALIGSIFGIRYLSRSTWVEKGQFMAIESNSYADDTYLDEMLDYAMIDNHEIYAYLSESE